MKNRVDEQLRREVEQYRLAFTCEHCVHFVAESGSCGNGYPNQAHRRSELDDAGLLEFCKEFELA